MKSALAIALLLTTLPAYAGSLTWVVTTGSNTPPTVAAPAGGTSTPFSATIADADIARIVADYATIPGYQQIQDTNTDGSPKVDGSGNPVMRATTSVDIPKMIVTNTLAGLLANAMSQEKAAAAIAAAQGVSPITATPQ